MFGNPQFDIFILAQPAAAAAKDYEIVAGYRPGLVLLIDYKNAGNVAVQVDPSQIASSKQLAGGFKMATNSVAAAGLGADGIKITDEGCVLGQDAFIKANGAVLVAILFRGGETLHYANLASVPTKAASLAGQIFKTTSEKTKGGGVFVRS